MDRERRRRIEALFDGALEHETDEREAFLAAESGGDDSLLAGARALLAAHALAEHVFAGPANEPAVFTRPIGVYRVIREIGRGGMGTVYLAERADGQYRRRVAIKLIATSNADDPLHQRFLAERQILAALDHPHIARLLDGGLTDDGRPYLVLEYVDGVPITEYCDRHRLGIDDRIRLFLDVCDAVQHAHQNLVIHRDLKPGNILVTPAAQLKLLDFGIAKLLNPALSAVDAPVTRLDLRVMTPEYASPEQVRGDSITTASDVYALGVLLYELLTGSPPYHLTTHSPAEVMQAVCERDPERPSTRVLRVERLPRLGGEAEELTPASRARARALPAERLRRRLQGDLDSIVLMALRKEPGRRYASADQLGQDLRRYREGLPVLAHRGSRRYRVGKLVRRHRAGATAAGLVAVSLLAGLGTSLWQARLAHEERDRADRARTEAMGALAQSQTVTEFLMDLFRSGEPATGAPGGPLTADDLLRRGLARAGALDGQPVVQARLLDVIGQMYFGLGRYDDAARLLARAVALQRGPGEPTPGLAESLIHLSRAHRSRGEIAEARRLVAEALEVRRRTLAPDDPALAEAVHELGRVSDRAEQERHYRDALGLLQRSGAQPERQVALLQGLTTNLRRQDRLVEALELDRDALRLAEQRLGPDHAVTGNAMIHLGDQERDLADDPDAAERLYRRGLEIMTRQLGENNLQLIHGLHSLSYLLSARGEHAEAEQLMRRALAIRTAATGPDHPQAALESVGLALRIAAQGRHAEAEATIRAARLHLIRVLGPNHTAVAGVNADLADVLAALGRGTEADSAYRAAIGTFAALGERGIVHTGETHRRYGRQLLRQRRFDEAETQLLRSLAVLESAYAPSSETSNVHETKRALMELYLARGRPDLAERYRAPPGRHVSY
jgi:eukaryotic-like serine/threonine-protein kinase